MRVRWDDSPGGGNGMMRDGERSIGWAAGVVV
jgi:hypothetical protein